MPRASFTPLAESGLLIRLGGAIEAETNARALALADALGREAVAGIVDAVPAYTTVLVTFDPTVTDATSVEQAANRFLPTLYLRAAPDRMREIPVSYGGDGGPDLADVAAHSGLSVEDVVALHAAAEYRVACVGFCPGFAFLLGLPSELETPRRRSPRTRVPVGSVAIGGGQTGVYPLETPGGWNLIGRTEVPLFDPSRPDPFFLRPGDTVRFVPVESVEQHASEVGLSLRGETGRGEREVGGGALGAGVAGRPGSEFNRTTSPPVDAVAGLVDLGNRSQRGDADGTDKERAGQHEVVPARETGDVGVPERTVTILEGGAEATVQDLGRPGLMHLGVSPGGALDRRALVLGNRLLGNDPGAAGIEIALAGPKLRFDASVLAVVAGADLGATLDGAPLPRWQPFMARPGQTLAFDNAARPGFGLRAYLCLDGGIATPPVMGSRTTDLFGGIGGVGGRALRAGDALPLGAATADPTAVLRRRLRVPPPSPEVDAGPIRVVLGPQLDRFTTEGVSTFLDAEWTVALRSDRMGLRLEGPPIALSAGADAISEGIAAGSIQVPGDGQPIALLPARQTIGGYPKIAVVVGADLDRLGQLGPNDTVRFSEVTLAEARRLTVAAAAELGEGAVLDGPGSAAGWDPNWAEMGRMETVDRWNPEAVERLVRAVAKTEASRFRLELTGAATVRLEWERSSIAAPVEQEREAPLFDPPSPFATPIETDGVSIITAPLLGVFYRRPDPDTPPFAEEGQQVAGGAVLGLIEVMKTFHEVRAPRPGILAAYLVEDGATVQFGDPLVRLD